VSPDICKCRQITKKSPAPDGVCHWYAYSQNVRFQFRLNCAACAQGLATVRRSRWQTTTYNTVSCIHIHEQHHGYTSIKDSDLEGRSRCPRAWLSCCVLAHSRFIANSSKIMMMMMTMTKVTGLAVIKVQKQRWGNVRYIKDWAPCCVPFLAL